MKKSMVLLIALLFISAISVLILKNLDDTNSYIKQQNHKLNKLQISSLLKNIESEVQNVIKRYKDNLSLIYGQTFPLTLEDIEFTFTLDEYSKPININHIISENTESQEYKDSKNALYERDITQVETLRSIGLQNSNNKISSNKQLDDIISKFKKETYDNKILEIKEDIGFLSIAQNEKLYKLNTNIIYQNELISAKYILSENNGSYKVRYFELSFK